MNGFVMQFVDGLKDDSLACSSQWRARYGARIGGRGCQTVAVRAGERHGRRIYGDHSRRARTAHYPLDLILVEPSRISALFDRYVEMQCLLGGCAFPNDRLRRLHGGNLPRRCRQHTRGANRGRALIGAALSADMASPLPSRERAHTLPALANQWISLIKETSLISIVGLTDIMRVAAIGAGSLRAPLTFSTWLLLPLSHADKRRTDSLQPT